jgi:hypothetical protein
MLTLVNKPYQTCYHDIRDVNRRQQKGLHMLNILLTALSVVTAPVVDDTVDGFAKTESARVEVSERSITLLRFAKGEGVSDVVLDPRSGVRMEIVSEGAIALTGAPSAGVERMLIRRASGLPLEVTLVGSAAGSPVKVVDFGKGSLPAVSNWSRHDAGPAILSPGFVPAAVLRTDGVDAEVNIVDGTVTAMRTSSQPSGIVVLGEAGEAGIYRLD